MKNIKECKIKGAYLLEHDIFHDDRGFFYESWNEQEFQKIGIKEKFVQDNRSRSYKNVIRGLHFQVGPNAQGKLVSVTHGCVWDVFVDLRKDSETYGQWEGYYLSAEEGNKLFIPAGCAHGFLVLSDIAEFSYKCTRYYDPNSEASLVWDDPIINIKWPLPEGVEPILSEKDKKAPFLSEFLEVMNTEEYPNPYTSCDDPEVDHLRKDWRGNVLDIKRIRYSDFPCKDLVDDLVSSPQLEVFKQWDRNFRRKYYTRALFMAYEQGKESNERFFDKLKLVVKNKLECFAYWILRKLW